MGPTSHRYMTDSHILIVTRGPVSFPVGPVGDRSCSTVGGLSAGPPWSRRRRTRGVSIGTIALLGLAYEKPSRLAGSAFEPLLKKCDFFLKRTMENSYPVREERAEKVLEANSLMRNVIDQAKQTGAFHQYFQYQLISSIDPFKRKRGRQNFDELFDKVIGKLTRISEDPDRIRRLGRD